MGPVNGILSCIAADGDRSARIDNRTGDETLARAAQGGDARAAALLVERHGWLIRKLGRRYFLPGHERDDLMQEGALGLIYAIRTYDGSLDPSFVNHAARCILNHLVAAVRKATRKRAAVLTSACSFEEAGEVAAAFGTEDQAIHRVTLREVGKQMRDLTPHERQVLTARMIGYSQSEICQMAGLTTKQVENSLYRARTKMRASNPLAETA
jgi:RNA polymerase sporulation-specific sigma factor